MYIYIIYAYSLLCLPLLVVTRRPDMFLDDLKHPPAALEAQCIYNQSPTLFSVNYAANCQSHAAHSHTCMSCGSMALYMVPSRQSNIIMYRKGETGMYEHLYSKSLLYGHM